MSGIVKSIGRGVKKIFKGVKKVFKKVVKSDLFKVAAGAALIYFGGQALGAWGGGGASSTTTLAAGEAGTAAAGGTAGTAGSTVAGGTAGTTTATTAATGGTTAAGGGTATVGGGAAGNIPLPEIVTEFAPKQGFISNALKGAGTFVKEHPMASAMGLNAVSSALSPDEEELMRERERIRRERWQNMGVPGSIGMQASGRPLYHQDGTPVYDPQGMIDPSATPGPRGMINSRIRRTS